MGNLKSFEILKAVGKLGSNFSFSMALIASPHITTRDQELTR